MQRSENTRDTEALLSAAGFSPITRNNATGDADVLIERFGENRFLVTMVSPRALGWASAELCCALRQCFAGRMELDMMSADRLLKQAHAQGFRTEFTGRSGKDLY